MTPSRGICATAACNNPTLARGYCSGCYQRNRRNGTLPTILIRDDQARFWANVNKTKTCWEWTGRVRPDGYAEFNYLRRSVPAHRWLWTQINGPLSNAIQLDHICRNRRCVNPQHLDPVTPRVNTLRGIGPSAVNARKTHCLRGHEFTEDNTYHHNGRRHCRTCRRLAEAKRAS